MADEYTTVTSGNLFAVRVGQHDAFFLDLIVRVLQLAALALIFKDCFSDCRLSPLRDVGGMASNYNSRGCAKVPGLCAKVGTQPYQKLLAVVFGTFPHFWNEQLKIRQSQNPTDKSGLLTTSLKSEPPIEFEQERTWRLGLIHWIPVHSTAYSAQRLAMHWLRLSYFQFEFELQVNCLNERHSFGASTQAGGQHGGAAAPGSGSCREPASEALLTGTLPLAAAASDSDRILAGLGGSVAALAVHCKTVLWLNKAPKCHV